MVKIPWAIGRNSWLCMYDEFNVHFHLHAAQIYVYWPCARFFKNERLFQIFSENSGFFGIYSLFGSCKWKNPIRASINLCGNFLRMTIFLFENKKCSGTNFSTTTRIFGIFLQCLKNFLKEFKCQGRFLYFFKLRNWEIKTNKVGNLTFLTNFTLIIRYFAF